MSLPDTRVFVATALLATSLFAAQAVCGQQADADTDVSPGQAALDEATQLRLTDDDSRQLNKVIDLLEEALDEGLDDENEKFANQMLASALIERAEALSSAIINRPLPDPRRDPRWMRIRQLALADLQKTIEIDDSQHQAHFLIGLMQSLPLGDKDAARDAFTKVIQSEGVEDKMLAEAHARRAGTLQDVDARGDDLNRAVELMPDAVEFRLMRARHLFDAEEFDRCLADVDRVLELAPDNFATHELRGLVLQAQDKIEEALESFDKATEIAPQALTPYVRRSELYARQGDLDKAIDEAAKAIDVESENPLGYLLRADLLLKDERPDEALDDVNKASELRPGIVQALLLRAQAYELLDRTDEALGQLEELAESIEPQLEIQVQIGAMALRIEQPRRAIRALDRAIEIDPESFIAWRLRGDAKLNIGQHESAIADYETAAEIDPEDSGVLNNLAWTLATSPQDEVRDGERALELATKSCELTDYKQAHILSTLAAAHAELGDFDKAKEWAKKAVDLDDEENAEQIAQELASYEAGKPWRESQQLDAGERPQPEESAARKPDKPVESQPAPGRTIDF